MNEIDEILANIDIEEKENSSPQSDIPSAGGSAPDIANEQPADSLDDNIPAIEPVVPDIVAGDLTGTDVPPPPIEGREEAPAEAPRHEYSVKGTKSWNTREPYIIKINADALQKDRADLHQTFYFSEEPGDAESGKHRINQEIVKYLRKPNNSIAERYSDFICKNIIIIGQNISRNFELSPDNEKFFIHHIGPLTIYKILKEELINKKFGFCYKYMPGNKAVKYFPAEFIKESILKWYADNINILDMPFDSIQKLEEMRSIAQKKYQNDLRIFNTRLDQLHAKIEPNKTISRHKLLQLKGTQWFGFQNIEIYKRFLGASIFI
jgi:hypothetical protein